MEAKQSYVLCVENRGHEASLEVRKLYSLVEDAGAEARDLVRVIDESGEDYLYPRKLFVPIEVPREAVAAFSRESA